MALAAAMAFGMLGCSQQAPSTPPAVPTDAPATEPPAAQIQMSVTEESTYRKPLPSLPEVPYWFPAQLLEWDPAQDPDAIYNVSSIPLAKRV